MGSDGAQGRERTTDTVIFSHVLYQLSYLGISPSGRKANAQVAQLVEHVTENHGVGGSIPPLGTITAHS